MAEVMEEITIQELLERFNEFRLARGYHLCYRHGINKYISYCLVNKIDIFSPTYFDFNRYMAYLQTVVSKYAKNNEKISNGTINNLLKSLRFFYKFLQEANFCSSGVVEDLIKIKFLNPEKRLRHVLSFDEIDKLISNTVTFITYMSFEKIDAIIHFLFLTGMRKDEFLRLKRCHIDLEKMQAVVKLPVKNDEEKVAYFTKLVKIKLQVYFASEQEEQNAFNLTYRQLSYFFEKLTKLLPNGIHITTHTFRHSFGNYLVEKDVGIKIAQKLFGHKSLHSTNIYYEPSQKVVERIYREKLEEGNK